MESLRRRSFCGLSLAALAALLDGGDARAERGAPGKALILLWLGGGPSQLETFDPKPGRANGGPTRAIATAVKGVSIAAGLPRIAEQMARISLVRSVVGLEGDHERATVLMKTGRRPEVNLSHPSIGAVCAAELPEDGTEIPRYVAVLGADGSRGGFLGQGYDPFRVGDPATPVEDVRAAVAEWRLARRLEWLAGVEASFASEHPRAEARTLHRQRTERALQTMRSPQLAAFDLALEPDTLRARYGDTPFGRGCLLARRLVEVGVRCVEVTLGGWDTHANNFSLTQPLCDTLDRGMSALVADLAERELYDSTVVLCTGEFGRTPQINPADGRDHWPDGFSLALAGGGLRAGVVVGETGPEGESPREAVAVADVYATVLRGLGLDPGAELASPGGRPVKLGDGKPIPALVG